MRGFLFVYMFLFFLKEYYCFLLFYYIYADVVFPIKVNEGYYLLDTLVMVL